MFSKRSREGYLLIDHRCAPASRGAGGAPSVGAGQLFESATSSCAHCQAIVVLNPDRTRERAHCWKCDRYICDACGAVGECRPFSKTLDLAAEAFAKGLHLGAGPHGKA